MNDLRTWLRQKSEPGKTDISELMLGIIGGLSLAGMMIGMVMFVVELLVWISTP